MLILARYVDEAVFIGQCRVTVLGIVRRKNGRTRVKIGIDAPPEIPILRAELPRLSANEQNSTPTSLEENQACAMPATVPEEAGA